jgi:16S rRNA (cytidine1402-2'-O)-methyltransferase
MSAGKLYIIPIPISEGDLSRSVPAFNVELLKTIRYFAVENTKTARRFLRAIDRTFPINDSQFFELNKHEGYSFDPAALQALKNGSDVGLMSESGYPGIADPGNGLVREAHENGISVVPLVGPSSIFMALAASGLNGQSFAFLGYVAQKEPLRSESLKKAISESMKSAVTQIFIETPYRNQSFFADVLKHADNKLKLCVALDVTGKDESIVTKSVEKWKGKSIELPKVPAIFLIGK